MMRKQKDTRTATARMVANLTDGFERFLIEHAAEQSAKGDYALASAIVEIKAHGLTTNDIACAALKVIKK